MGNEAELEMGKTKVKVKQTTDYPWEGKIDLDIDPASPVSFDLKMRIPGWCKSFKASVNGKMIPAVAKEDGYLTVQRKWKKGDRVSLWLDMPTELVAADPRVKENTGKRAVQRGPLVYCLEQEDNGRMDEAHVDKQMQFAVVPGTGRLEGMKILQARSQKKELTFIPYFAWDNRDAGKMKVWIDYGNE
jgi:DUF1680 family protein